MVSELSDGRVAIAGTRSNQAARERGRMWGTMKEDVGGWEKGE